MSSLACAQDCCAGIAWSVIMDRISSMVVASAALIVKLVQLKADLRLALPDLLIALWMAFPTAIWELTPGLAVI